MTQASTLVHYHIFKNAGTSIDASLKRSFGERWGCFEGTHAHDIQRPDQLARFMEANPQLAAISSHLTRPPCPTPACLPVVFIRHPLLRAYSVYQFTRNSPDQPFSDVAQDCGFADYIRWALREEPGSIVIRNYQVVHLSDASWRCAHILDAQATEQDLSEACALLDHWGMAGVVEQFDRSVDAYQARYSPRLPDLKLAYDWENVSPSEAGCFQTKLDRLQRLLGHDLYTQFMSINALDVALHAHATDLLEHAHAPTPQEVHRHAV